MYEDPKTKSGNVVKRYFCNTCGNPVKSETPPASAAGKLVLKLGIMDRIPEPEHEAFAAEKVSWIKAHDGTKRWEWKTGEEPAKSL